MILIDFVNQFSSWSLAVVIVSFAALYSVGLQILVRSVFGVSRLAKNHDVAAAKFHTLGVSYAVLLAFVVIVVWEEFRKAEDIVHAEAQSIFRLYQSTIEMDDETGAEIQAHLLAYASDIRDREWLAMRNGDTLDWPTANELVEIGSLIAHVRPSNLAELRVIQGATTPFQEMVDLRGERLADVAGTLPAVFWWVLVIGALVVLGFASFFAVAQLQAQILMTIGLAIVIGLTFFLTVDLSLPYSGGTAVSSEPLERVIELIERNKTSTDQR